MAIEHCDNFSIYGSNSGLLLNGVYGEINFAELLADPDGLSSGYVFFADSTSVNGYQAYIRYPLQSTSSILGISHRLWLQHLPTDSSITPCMTWRNGSNTLILGIGVTTTGRLYAYGNVAGIGSPLGVTASPVITANAWWHIEGKLDLTAQTFELRVEGETVLSLTGLSLGSDPIAQMSFGVEHGFGAVSVGTYRKDLVIWNNSGSHNTDFLGSVIVAMLSPSADVALNWTPTGGSTGAGILDNIPPQDGVQYLTALNPPPAAYVCSLTDLVTDVTSVKCIMTMVRAQKTDGGDASLQIGVISDPSGTPATVLGTDRPITVAQTYWRDVFEVDPKTSAPWLPSAVNAAQLKMNRTT